jgi:hypothetical protein
MLRHGFTMIMALAVLAPCNAVFAAEDKAVKEQRRDEQKQRQLQKNERNRKNNEALKTFREYAKSLKKEYQQKSRDLDTEFKLQRVELKAERDIRMANVEAEFQQNLTQLMLNPARNDNKEALEKFQNDIKIYSDKVFAIKKQGAAEEHEELIQHETNKHKLLSERDQMALEKAGQLGLQDKYTPILAKPIGDGLTRSEQSWNEREIKGVEKLYKSNQRQLGEFVYGTRLREWEIANKREDFNLEWEKQTELHALNGQQSYFNLFYALPSANQQDNAQQISQRLSEIQKQNRLIGIKYKKFSDQNRIKRQQQKKEIMGR